MDINLKTNCRPAWMWKLGDSLAHLFYPIVPTIVAHAIPATCVFRFQGLLSCGNEWGMGFRGRMQTFGHIPTFCQVGLGSNHIVQHSGRSRWVSFDSISTCNLILNVIDLSVNDVLTEFGRPTVGEQYIVTLAQIIRNLRDDLVGVEIEATAAA